LAEHYFTGAPTSRHEERTVRVQAGARALAFETDAGTFSKTRLDPGSRLLLDALPPLTGRCADIGCGWGPIGISLAAQNPDLFVEMVDVNERAVDLARRNAEANGVQNVRVQVSDGLAAVEPGLDACVTNPPIRAGKSVVYGFFAQAAEKLRPGGWLFAVVRKQQGAPSALKYLGEIFAVARVREKDAGYWILEAQKAE
jgi:16S rRNA (guanine1207-N2)-methyltransferase